MMDIRKHIVSIERTFGCKASFHDYEGRLATVCPNLPPWHMNPFCDRVRRPKELFRSCLEMETGLSRREGERLRSPFLKHCHAGVCEAVIPLVFEGRLSASVFLGPFKIKRVPPGVRLLKQGGAGRLPCQLEKAAERLPFFDEERLEDLLNMGELLCRALSASFVPDEVDSAEAIPERRVARFLDRSFKRKDLYLADLAKFMGLSQAGVCAFLKRVFKKSFSSLLSERRMEHARHLLGSTFLKLEIVSSECGYKDSSYFQRVFKRMNGGLSPGSYRKSLRLGAVAGKGG